MPRLLFFFFCVFGFCSLSHAQAQGTSGSHVNLEDIQIKGETNSDNVHFDQRGQFNLKERIKLRTSFLDRVEENGHEFLKNKTP